MCASISSVSRGLASESVKIAFLGTSGVGKTYLCEMLKTQEAFCHVESDELIGASPEMAELIVGVPGEDAAKQMGNLFGVPWEDTERYRALQEKFLGIEKKVMTELVANIHHGDFQKNTVFDVTGSIIYLPEELQAMIDTGVVTVHLEASKEHINTLVETFLSDPKPVYWGALITEWEKSGKEDLPTLFPQLLSFRTEQYEKAAKVALPWDMHRNIKSAEALLCQISERL